MMNKEFNDQGEERVAELLGSLKKVSAPNDFEFRVNARIAQGRPAEPRKGVLFPTLRLVMPIALMLVVSAAFIINYSYSVDPESVRVASAADGANAALAPETDFTASFLPVNEAGTTAAARENTAEIAAAETDPDLIAAASDRTARPQRAPNMIEASSNPSPKPEIDDPNAGGGSFDRALRSPGGTILPPGITIAPPVTVETDPANIDRPISPSGILSRMGIDARSSGGVWVVRSVRTNSPADRSGIAAGDEIEAIDGRSISGESSTNGSFSGKTLRVKRDGKTLFIDLRN